MLPKIRFSDLREMCELDLNWWIPWQKYGYGRYGSVCEHG